MVKTPATIRNLANPPDPVNGRVPEWDGIGKLWTNRREAIGARGFRRFAGEDSAGRFGRKQKIRAVQNPVRRQKDRNHGAPAHLALKRQGSPVQLHQALGQGQS